MKSARLLAFAAPTFVLALAAGPASAHVTADAPGAAQGGYGVITFSVPTERADDATVKLKITLPALKHAAPEPIAGWTASTETNDKKEITAVTWTANPGTGIAPGQFQRFVLAAGPLPKQERLSFTAAQTYGKGEVVNWDEPAKADGSEPDRPAPEIKLGKAKSSAGHDHGASTDPVAEEHHGDTTARWLGGAGLALGLLGLAAGVTAVLRGRQR